MPDYQAEWLRRIEDKLDKVGTATESIPAITQRLKEHHIALYGNGQPGLVKDVDRLKQWRHSLKWLVGLIVSIAAAGAAETARTLFK